MATHAFCIDRILCAYIKEQQQQQHRKMKPIKVEKKKKKKGTKLKAKTIRIFGGQMSRQANRYKDSQNHNNNSCVRGGIRPTTRKKFAIANCRKSEGENEEYTCFFTPELAVFLSLTLSLSESPKKGSITKTMTAIIRLDCHT